MTHYHSIEIKEIDWNIFDLRVKIENQFYTKVSANPDKYCINNNLPNDDVMYYHEYKMVVLENGKFIELDFVFFILFDPGRIEIIHNNGTIFAKFEMLDVNTTQNFDLEKIFHIPRVTCHPKSKAILNENGKLFHYEHKDSNKNIQHLHIFR